MNKLSMKFDGSVIDRGIFLNQIRHAVMEFTGERMTLDALINEIAKNIFDHARGKGSLEIRVKHPSIEFEIKDDGQDSFNLEYCMNNSRLVGNGVNCGVGLRLVIELAKNLGVNLVIDTSRGFSYSGVYILRKAQKTT